MQKALSLTALSLSTALAGPAGLALADSYEVRIVNATRGQVITPPFVAVHNHQVSLFQLGKPAPDYLVPLAEDGDSSAVVSAARASANVHAVATGEGAIPPGHSLTLSVESDDGFPLLTVAAMLATSNDAFLAVHSMALPEGDTPTSLSAQVYDAGSEANSESCHTIPGPPCGSPGFRDSDGAEGFVHVHSGIHGIGDLAPETYDWRNPGAYVTVRKVD